MTSKTYIVTYTDYDGKKEVQICINDIRVTNELVHQYIAAQLVPKFCDNAGTMCENSSPPENVLNIFINNLEVKRCDNTIDAVITSNLKDYLRNYYNNKFELPEQISCTPSCDNTHVAQQQGGKPKKYTKTPKSVKVGNATRNVYTNRGHEYVKWQGDFVTVKTAQKQADKGKKKGKK